MNMLEAIDLLKVTCDFECESLEEVPNFSIFDRQNDGFAICVKAESVDEDLHDYLVEVAESRSLRLHESEGYLVIG